MRVSSHGHRAWLSWLLVALIFAGGAGVGGGVAIMWMGRHLDVEPPEPEVIADELSAQMAEEYDLKPKQREHVRSVILKRHELMQSARDRLRDELDPELNQLDTEMAAVLGPEKALRWKERFEKTRGRWGKRRSRRERASKEIVR
ncbi:MAG: hypothetical protein DHS20C15_20130 [Planctomycetota bacterium]|nr:MAG: hypothetical protein DHS20C15_20130 [Planctomycetota bacterium]